MNIFTSTWVHPLGILREHEGELFLDHVANILEGLIGNDDNVVAGAVGLVGVDVLVEFVDEAEDEAMIFF